MDWSGCLIVETITGKVSGVPLVKGTRLPVQTILDNLDAGLSDIEVAQAFDVPLATVRSVVAFAQEHREPSTA